MDSVTAFWILWIGQLAACHRQLRRQLAVVASTDGLNDTECLLLCCCRWAPPGELSQQYLAAYIGLSPSQASGVFESLRARGLLTSESGVRDRRRQAWHITAEGDERIRRVGERLAPWISRLQSCLPCDDQKMILDLMQRLASIDANASATTPNSNTSRIVNVQEAA